jgi:hypothetical protein
MLECFLCSLDSFIADVNLNTNTDEDTAIKMDDDTSDYDEHLIMMEAIPALRAELQGVEECFRFFQDVHPSTGVVYDDCIWNGSEDLYDLTDEPVRTWDKVIILQGDRQNVLPNFILSQDRFHGFSSMLRILNVTNCIWKTQLSWGDRHDIPSSILSQDRFRSFNSILRI